MRLHRDRSFVHGFVIGIDRKETSRVKVDEKVEFHDSELLSNSCEDITAMAKGASRPKPTAQVH